MVRARLSALTFLVAMLCLAALGRLAWLQLVPSVYTEALEVSRHHSLSPEVPQRGRILARGREVLAGNEPVYDVYFHYSRLNPRDRLVDILARTLGEQFESARYRERIEERILELARPEELAGRPELPNVLERLPPESEGTRQTGEDGSEESEEWLFLIGSIHATVKDRIVAAWRRSRIARYYYASLFEFRESETAHYFDLFFARRRLVHQEIVLLRLARLLAASGERRPQSEEYDRLLDRVAEVRKRFEDSTAREMDRKRGPPPDRRSDPKAYRSWRTQEEVIRWMYHRQLRLLAEDVPLDVVSVIECYPASFRGLSARSGTRRVYPQNEVCGSLLGYLSSLRDRDATKIREDGYMIDEYLQSDDTLERFLELRSELRSPRELYGAAGLERYYDRTLRGEFGASVVQEDSLGRFVKVVRHVPAVDGGDLVTTIDLPLQRRLHEELTRVSSGSGPHSGNAASAVVLDVSSGALLACAGVPSVDPNRMRDGSYAEELEARWGQQTDGWYWDRPTRHKVEPGSVFKIVLAVAAMENAAALDFSPTKTAYACQHKFPLFKIHCNSRYGHGLKELNLIQALKHSCNNYFFHLGYDLLKPEGIDPWARRLGFGRSPGVDLPVNTVGYLESPDQIKDIGICYYSIGQVHVRASAVQVARCLGLIASGGGELRRPYLVHSTGAGETVTFSNPDTTRVINDGLWRAAHEAQGTAARPELGLSGFRVALKTGTAEVVKGNEELNHAWLAGYAPASPRGEPRVPAQIAFAVTVEETRGHGADVCAPVVRAILEHFASRDPDAWVWDRARLYEPAAGD